MFTVNVVVKEEASDEIPSVAAPTIFSKPNEDDWNNTKVTVLWLLIDDESKIISTTEDYDEVTLTANRWFLLTS